MYPPKARRITPVVTIPTGMARLFFEIFSGLGSEFRDTAVRKRNPRAFSDSLVGPVNFLWPPARGTRAEIQIWPALGRSYGAPDECIAGSDICCGCSTPKCFSFFDKIFLT